MDSCCQRPALMNMDHNKGDALDPQPTVNRMCQRCGTHWYGPAGSVTEYTRAEWDRWINADSEIAAPTRADVASGMGKGESE